MSRSRRRTGPLEGLAVLLLLCALAVRVVVPQGFMWSTGADGTPEMVFCSAGATAPFVTPLAATALAAQHDSDRRDHDGKTTDHPCAFASASAAVDLAATIHPAASAPFTSDTPIVSRPVATPGRGLAAPPPPKTGPPILA